MTAEIETGVPSDIPYKKINYIRPDVDVERRADGALVMTAADALWDYDEKVADWIDKFAVEAPDRKFIVVQTDNGEVDITYKQAREQCRRIGARLIELGLNEKRPVAILASNSIPHALIMMACYYVGVPISPMAPAYALQATDYSKLQRNLDLLDVGMVIVEEGAAFENAITQSLKDPDAVVVALDNPVGDMKSYQWLFESDVSDTQIDAARDAVTADSIAKFLFTSGSSGVPKAVVNTHRMLCSAAMMQRQVCSFLMDQPPVMVDWCPWNHTAGGNSNFNIILYHGGTLYLDPGKPTPKEIGATIELLKRVSPTLYFNVPMGYQALLPFLENDADLRASFFKNLQFLWYAAAALQPEIWQALDEVACKETGERILIVTGLGMTETAPQALYGNFLATGPGNIGVPMPGVELKLTPFEEDRYEAWYRGPNVFPGYWKAEEATWSSFDDEGYFTSGDLIRFVDPERPEKGLVFDGRASEDFKLTTGTKVPAGALRLGALNIFNDLVNDLVIVGEGRDDVRMLVFPNWVHCQGLAEGKFDVDDFEGLSNDPAVMAEFRDMLAKISASGSGSSGRIVAAGLMTVPPSNADGEVTDKGSINARALVRNRTETISELFAVPKREVIVLR